MKSASLIGKTVNVGGICEDRSILDLLVFFYPGFAICSSIAYFVSVQKMIYIGEFDEDIPFWLNQCEKLLINTTAIEDRYDYDFTNRREIIKFVYSKWELDAECFFCEEDFEYIEQMEFRQFLDFVKSRWACQRICLDDILSDDIGKSRNNVHSIIGKSYGEILYFCNSATDDNIRSLEFSMLKFIEAARLKQSSKSNEYFKNRQLYDTFNSIFDDDYIVSILSIFRQMDNNRRFRLIWLLSQFSFDRNNINGEG